MTDEPTKPEKDRKLPKRTETWAEDQQDRGYYYDDSTGYVTYEPDDEEAEEDADDRSKPSA
jgi:hypothetical protein